MATDGPKSQYTEEQIFTSVEAAHIVGSTREAARLTGVPKSTISYWKQKERSGNLESFAIEKARDREHIEEAQDSEPMGEAMEDNAGKNAALEAARMKYRIKYVEKAWQACALGINRLIELLPEANSIKDVAVAVGVLTEKIQLLSGGPTTRSESVRTTDREDLLKAAQEVSEKVKVLPKAVK